jgi:hypothetical protein
MERLKNSQLIVTDDGAIYHLNLRPENIADTILLVIREELHLFQTILIKLILKDKIEKLLRILVG